MCNVLLPPGFNPTAVNKCSNINTSRLQRVLSVLIGGEKKKTVSNYGTISQQEINTIWIIHC
jgi:hypothetical protein